MFSRLLFVRSGLQDGRCCLTQAQTIRKHCPLSAATWRGVLRRDDLLERLGKGSSRCTACHVDVLGSSAAALLSEQRGGVGWPGAQVRAAGGVELAHESDLSRGKMWSDITPAHTVEVCVAGPR